ncbi:MAG: SIMPL domain-containing protein [Pseudomonadota bacterium]|nr:SIMPL domain-containing protein [Pseudomonadota bacterium]
MKYLILSLMSLTVAFSAQAEERTWPNDATLVTLSEQATRKVAQDRLNATLRVEAKGVSPRSVQDDVNTKMKKALALAKMKKTIDVTTGNYNVYSREERNKDGKLIKTRWYASHSIVLDSEDNTTLLELAGDIQELGFVMNGLNFYLSEEKSAKISEELLLEALKRLQSKAKAIGATLGKDDVHLANVNTSGYMPPRPQPMYKGRAMAMMEMAADMAAPVAEGGDDTVRVTVNATAVLMD